MGQKAMLLILLKAIGLCLVVHGLGAVVSAVTQTLYSVMFGRGASSIATMSVSALVGDYYHMLIWLVGSLIQIVFGVYLFLGGRRLVSLALPGRRPCGECGYDLYRSASDRCPECGTPRPASDPAAR